MVLIRLVGIVIGTEALNLLIVIVIDVATAPTVTFDSKVVIAFTGQFTPTCPTLEESLRQGDGRRDMVTLHLFDGDVFILVDILLISLVPTDLSLTLKGRQQGYKYKKLPHTINICAKVVNSLELFVFLR